MREEMKYRKHARHFQGFTLIEALMALGVFCIGIMGMAALASASIKMNQAGQDTTRALNLADRLAARFRAEAIAWNDMPWNPAGGDDPNNVMALLRSLPAPGVTPAFVDAELTSVLAAATQPPTDLCANPPCAFSQNLTMVNTNDNAAKFCVHYGLTWLQPHETIRVDLRIYWLRRTVFDTDIRPDFRANCGATEINQWAADNIDLWCTTKPIILSRNR